MSIRGGNLKLTIVFNNEALEGLKAGWGFSALIEKDGKRVLFDTGCDGGDLMHNMEKLGIDASGIDAVVISHQHRDHTGGLFDLLQRNRKAEVFVLETFSEHFKSEVRARAGRVTEVSRSVEIAKGIHTTGIVQGSPDEQALAVKTSKGLAVIVGCSHPGVDRLLEKAVETCGQGRIHAVIGGFHGFSDLEKLKGIDIIGACHCTQKIEGIKEMYPDQFREIKAGDVIDL